MCKYLYRGKKCMKKFCTSFREDTKNITDFEKKKMLPLTKKELKSHQDVGKLEIIRSTAYSICNLTFNVPNESRAIYDYYFIRKELAKKFEREFQCLWNIQKSTNFFRSNKKRSYKN